MCYGKVLGSIFPHLSETEKGLDTVALMMAWRIPGCHQDKKLDAEPYNKTKALSTLNSKETYFICQEKNHANNTLTFVAKFLVAFGL